MCNQFTGCPRLLGDAMADQTVKIRLQVDDAGDIRRKTQDAKEFNKEKAKFEKGSAALSSMQYGRARGASGLTGASARDFANEQQGLGGLVRLYATVAANTYAAATAFKALSEAMNFNNMIAGLDALGAASGKNLGGLSKRVSDLTNGAVSMQDAMKVVAQTSTAGISSKDIERLTVVAKNASLALGLSMPDALNRLSRGVVKLEPELLDELGLFTKIGPATEAYARSLGKTTASLSDFERRQAFLNAIIKEGETSFSALGELTTNPYEKLAATLKNLSQQGLNFVNKVLVPVVEFLSSSPMALATALGAVGFALVKQALPALGEFKSGLARSATTAADLAAKKAQDAKLATAAVDKQILDRAEKDAEAHLNRISQAEENLSKLKKERFKKDAEAQKILAKATQEVNAQDLAYLDKKAQMAKSDKGKQYWADIKQGILDSQAAEKKYTQEKDASIVRQEKAAKDSTFLGLPTSIYGATLQAAQSAQEAATKKGIISNAAYNGSLIGLTGSWKLMNAEIEKNLPNLTNWEKSALKARGAAAIFAGALSAVTGVLNGFLGAIGIATGLFSVFDYLFSNNKKEAAAFSSAIDIAKDSVLNMNRVLALLDKQGGFSYKTIAGINAVSNALGEVANSAETAVATMRASAEKMTGFWDKTKDSILSVIGKSEQQELSKTLAGQIKAALEGLNKSGIPDAGLKLRGLVGLDKNTLVDLKSLSEYLETLSNTQLDQVVDGLKKIADQANQSNQRLQAFKSSTEGLKKAYDEFIQSTASSNPLFKVGAAIEKVITDMTQLQRGGPGSIDEVKAALLDLAQSPEKAMLFGPEFTTGLLNIRTGFLEQTKAIENAKNELVSYDRQIGDTENTIVDLKKQLAELESSKFAFFSRPQQSILKAEINKAKGNLTILEEGKSELKVKFDALPTDKIQAASKIFTTGLEYAFKEGSRLIDVALGQASEKAALTIAKAKLGGLTGEERAVAEQKIALQEIAIRERAIKTNIDLILSNEKLTATINESNALENYAIVEGKFKAGTATQSELTIASTGVIIARAVNEAFNNLGKGSKLVIPESVQTAAGIDFTLSKDDRARAQAAILRAQQQVAGQKAALIETGGERGAVNINAQRAKETGRLDTVQKLLQAQQNINAAELTQLSTLNSIIGYSTQELAISQNELETKQLTLKQLQQLDTAQTAINNTEENSNSRLLAIELKRSLEGVHRLENQNQESINQKRFIDAQIQEDQRRRTNTDKFLALREEELGLEKQLIDLQSKGLLYLGDSAIQQKNLNETQSLAITQIKRRNTLEGELSDLRKQESNTDNPMALAQFAERIKLKENELTTVKGIQLEEQKLLEIRQRQAERDNKFAKEVFGREIDYAAREQNLAYREQETQLASEILGIETQINLLMPDEISKREKLLKIKELEQATEQKLLQIAKTRESELAKLQKDQRDAAYDQEFGILSPEDEAQFNLRKKYIEDTYNNEKKLIDRNNEAKLQAIGLQYSMTDRMKAYDQTFQQAFSNMADAIVTFAQTGKLNFKGLIDSMIADLIRFELKQQMMALYAPGGDQYGGGLRSALMSGVKNFFTPSIQGSSGSYGMNEFSMAAKGAAYDQGYPVHKFAMGGAFTNSIVDSPTLFKFANGAGLMGEAGPEAIMPLKRGSDGSLGVQSQPSNVNVVVNNHTGQPAQTKETMDSRGNRTIEVIVGDVVAQQIAAKGSPIQQSMSSTYGNRPALARR